ncbi:MAG: TadE/TadG family type IV pilus assembly protein [Gemmataceae bacterium]
MKGSNHYTYPATRMSKRRRGAATVELAVLAPLLAILVLGTIEIGRLLMVRNVLNDAARVGCRVASKSTTTSTAQVNNEIQKILIDNNISTGGAQVQVFVHRKVGTGDTATFVRQSAQLNTARPGMDGVEVVVSLPYANVAWLGGNTYLNLASSYQITSQPFVMMRQ